MTTARSDIPRNGGPRAPGSQDHPTTASWGDPSRGGARPLHGTGRRTYPTISGASWWDLRRRFQRAIPEAVDAEFLQAVLGIRKTLAKNLRRQLISIGLIDAANTPTELAARWRTDADYPAACRQILSRSYPDELLEVCPPPTPERLGVERWFERNANVGSAAAARMAAFYLLVAASDPGGSRGAGGAAGQAKSRADPTQQPSPPAAAAMPIPEAEEDVRSVHPWSPSRRRGEYAKARNRYLARRWLVIAIAMLIGGLAGFGVAAKRPDRYVASTPVVATKSQVGASQVGAVAETVFSTDSVLQPVIDQLGLNDTPASLLASGTLHIESVAGSPALRIVARSADPQQARDLANAAADSFVAIAQQKGLGTFTPFESGPATLTSHETGLLVALGVVGGACIAVLILIMVFFLRDPVVSEEDALREFSPDAAFRLEVSSRRTPTDHDVESPNGARFDVWPNGVVSTLVETVHGRDGRVGRDPCAVVAAGSDSVWAGEAVAHTLELRASGQDGQRDRTDGFAISSSDDPGLRELLAASDPVVTIVPIGTPSRSVRRVDEELRALGTRYQVLVLVDPRR